MKRTKIAYCTPKTAVIRFCKLCAVDIAALKACDNVDCLFHKYRLGKGRPPLSIIRKYCVQNCMGGLRKLVKECDTQECPLHIYRFGKNPNRKGVGDINNVPKNT